MPEFTLHHGNCLDILKTLPPDSIDSIVTDPPYGLKFMGKRWDYDVPSVEIWAECLRVLKPGGHLLAFAGTRTQHRMAVRIEDAGFEIRDMIAWVYGSGFPKSHNLEGYWQGWGTALKPAMEPITVARKPLIGTVAENALQYETGALNIDACRVPVDPVADATQLRTMNRSKRESDQNEQSWGMSTVSGDTPQVIRPEGRWPANLIHDGSEEVLEAFPQAPGQLAKAAEGGDRRKDQNVYGAMTRGSNGAEPREDGGSAARFFYCAKASKSDRGEGNTHPTVKPTNLMRYLCRLVTPVHGVVLDPFMGSGSTGKAAIIEGRKFIGIEMDQASVEIARGRISSATAETP